MKKHIVLFMLIFSGALSAQIDLDFGIRAGFNYGYKGKLTELSISKISENSTKVGWNLGVYSRFEMLNFYVQPEIYYSQFKNDFSGFSLTSKRLDIPVIIGTRFLKFGRIGLGPVFSANFNDKISTKTIKKISNDDFTIGGQIRAGVDVFKFSLDVGYEFGFNNAKTKFMDKGIAYEVKKSPSMLIVSLGYNFL